MTGRAAPEAESACERASPSVPDAEEAPGRPAEPPRRSVSSPVLVIRPTSGWVAMRLGELWTHRELLWVLIKREITVRYKQTLIGGAWAIIQPAATMLLFWVVFRAVAHVPSDGVPYPLFAFTGLVLWQLFSRALAEASLSLVANERIVTKVYFPRLLVPTSVVLSGLLDFLIALVVLVALIVGYGHEAHRATLLAPCFVLLAVLCALGITYWLAALNVAYRDVRYVLPFLTQFLLYATPIAYPISEVPAKWRGFVALNPMAGVVEGFRWTLLGTRPPSALFLGVSVATVLALFLSGAAYFKRVERTIADTI